MLQFATQDQQSIVSGLPKYLPLYIKYTIDGLFQPRMNLLVKYEGGRDVYTPGFR
jgi:hypothetical protein